MTEHSHAPISVEEMAHAFEEEAAPVDLSPYAVEDWVTLAVFWGMGLAVFLQFFTRYVLNDSFAWTEEIAANCLVVVVFLGSVMCVRMVRHIQVDLLYRFLPGRIVRALETTVDAIAIAFFAYVTWLMWRYLEIVGDERMVTVDLPRGIVFYTVFAAFALMFLRSLQNLIRDLTGTKSVREQAQEHINAGGI
ncbi:MULTISPECIES: TRAP transporter small permease [Rhizobium/Agrobacterium group]|uniref:TRAP transporter small permease protein n=2 Tax=Neorhizobium TaxID=1525371 RepID=A0ABV0LXK8_9HYPH|nr:MULTISPECIES: TRAP transporter small permease [Rhizobium/Agrobacterium group]KGE00161.1 ABC transporter permease [Rhizobium sp. YS-1r]MCC2611207.1 TRAP transporter small permease [Neorhizobium petrolearium]WGI66414.1 TRAP transporter small permease [Neorhizobium petrolearium]